MSRFNLAMVLLRRQLEHRDGIEARLIGRSPQMEKVRRRIMDIAEADVDVLVTGETGTGKEVVARCLHDLSKRSAQNYVALNCGGLPDNLLDSELFGHEPGVFTGAQKRRIGKIEHANGGTLFLDEVESMQIKLLRVLQERTIERLGSNELIPVTCRVVAGSKEDLKVLSSRQKFRTDLYYRLNVVTIELPPAELVRQQGNGTRASEALGIARTTLHDKMRKYGLTYGCVILFALAPTLIRKAGRRQLAQFG